jgi:hypothetical protein
VVVGAPALAALVEAPVDDSRVGSPPLVPVFAATPGLVEMLACPVGAAPWVSATASVCALLSVAAVSVAARVADAWRAVAACVAGAGVAIVAAGVAWASAR